METPSTDQADRDSAVNSMTLKGLLKSLSQLAMGRFEPRLEILELQGGEILFEQGDAGDSMYVLVAGMLGVRVRHPDGTETIIDKLAPGAIVGEMALVSGQPRSATVYALNEVGLIRLSRLQLDELVQHDEAVGDELARTMAPRSQRLILTRILTDLLGQLDTASLHAIQDQLAWLHLSNGDVVFEQGDPQDGMYILINGRLGVRTHDAKGKARVVSEVESGETVGEYGLLTGEPRTATVYAIRESNLVKIEPPAFDRLVKEYPQVMAAVARIIVERQQRTLRGKPRSRTAALTVALIPAGPTVDGQALAQGLADSLSPYGDVLALTRERFDELYGQAGAAETAPDDPSNPFIVAWMGEQEAIHDFVLFCADANPSPWTHRCISQADRVLVIADPRADPAPGPAEAVLGELGVPVRTELVMYHPADTKWPAGTASWLAARRVQAHHHVRQGDVAHMARLARRLSGHAFGLVLSGGGARGYAHLGVYRALLELDIPVDFFGATSMGALLGAAFAQGKLTYDEMVEQSRQFASPRMLFDYTLPFTSVMTSKKVTRLCQRIYEDTRIEDLWVPFFCVSTNLSTAEPVVHEQGLLWRAVRASLAIPGVFTPVIEDGSVLVDGGVMDNFPAETMRAKVESDRVMGVHVSTHEEQKRTWNLDTYLSGWRVLYSRINPFAKPLRAPSLVGTILRTLDVNSAYRSKREQVYTDVLIHPDVKRFGFNEYEAFTEIAQVGYESALEPLRAWKQTLPELAAQGMKGEDRSA